MITLVDSNVILDVITDDPKWSQWSAEALTRAANESMLAINALIFAEISIRFATVEEVDQLFPPDEIARLPLPYDAAFLAGKAFVAYKRRGGARTAPLADFYIGAHAAVTGMRLLTRDPRRYRTYFPGVDLLAPE